MDTLIAFFVGMFAGMAVGIFFFAAIIASRDADERTKYINERSHEDE